MNTIDIKGDAQTFAEIMEGTISEFVDDAVGKIYDYAFYGASSLKYVELPNVLEIEKNAFIDCANLSRVHIPNANVVSQSAFCRTGIQEADFPNVIVLGDYAFSGCSELSRVSIPLVLSGGYGVFMSCASLSSVHMPSLNIVGSNMFRECSNLREISLPNATWLNTYAFLECINLESVYLLGSSIANVSTNTFSGTPLTNSSYLGRFGSVYVPASLVDAYKTHSTWSDYADRITAYTE